MIRDSGIFIPIQLMVFITHYIHTKRGTKFSFERIHERLFQKKPDAVDGKKEGEGRCEKDLLKYYINSSLLNLFQQHRQ
jgi:hypothetical protein